GRGRRVWDRGHARGAERTAEFGARGASLRGRGDVRDFLLRKHRQGQRVLVVQVARGGRAVRAERARTRLARRRVEVQEIRVAEHEREAVFARRGCAGCRYERQTQFVTRRFARTLGFVTRTDQRRPSDGAGGLGTQASTGFDALTRTETAEGAGRRAGGRELAQRTERRFMSRTGRTRSGLHAGRGRHVRPTEERLRAGNGG